MFFRNTLLMPTLKDYGIEGRDVLEISKVFERFFVI